jgi:hypothetical protein
MLTPTPPHYRGPRRAGRRTSPPPPVPPAGPVLGSASFLADDASLQLEFDGYDIDVGAFDPSSITVNDPASGSLYQATSAVVLGGIIVQVTMTPTGASSGTRTLLNATAATGIVSADDGTEWAGATGLELPFGS